MGEPSKRKQREDGKISMKYEYNKNLKKRIDTNENCNIYKKNYVGTEERCSPQHHENYEM